ncbi:hypothetical protein PPERSA_04127 [Pseudocohnilembus persalinus]|uniref:Uncharacterized protein n=1 Tax=Pseudocohnilembus persalinus TaxID=266149 RepID=A0A0V0QN42_PSEPJ|nr:hypothetical protein PPERSA_04127 [Pseudocohnilembus persalinus]|eukprot:KRX03575.1 hypothetical protein PPERSA_04127 [Pseudocohnilembus persalinus]
MEKDLYQKIQDYQALDCIRHEGQKLEFIILDQRKHLEPLCYDCIEENEQFKESDFKMQNIHYVLRSLLSSAQSIDSRIQELMANETLWFQNMNEQFAALIKRIQEQMDKIKIVGENSINKLQSLQEKGKSVEKLVEKFLDSNSQDEQYAVCQEIDNYIQIKNDNKIKIKNDYYRNSKKMQNFKFITENTQQLIDNVLQNNIEQINDELKNFDFTFVRSTFENSQEIKEIIPGREFLGQSLKGYQRIYSSMAFQNQIQQVDFSFIQSGKNLDNCFVVGIRQDSIKDNGITLIGSMLKQKGTV